MSSKLSLKLSNVNDLIFEICDPSDRCTPEQRIQRTHRMFSEIHSTLSPDWQSQHLEFSLSNSRTLCSRSLLLLILLLVAMLLFGMLKSSWLKCFLCDFLPCIFGWVSDCVAILLCMYYYIIISIYVYINICIYNFSNWIYIYRLSRKCKYTLEYYFIVYLL